MIRLVDNWRDAFKWGSIKLAALIGIVTAILTAHETILIGLIAFIPHGFTRYVVAVFVGLIVFIIPFISRITKWIKRDAEINAKR